MKIHIKKILSLSSIFFLTFILTISCSQIPQSSERETNTNIPQGDEIIIGYSNWLGWLPWAIAEEEGIFKQNNVNVTMKWFDNYLESTEALAQGKLDGNSQTLNDTIPLLNTAVNGEVVVLVNDNSVGNDKIIVTKDINKIEDLKGKKVAFEPATVNDFLLTLALESKGMKPEDVEAVYLETSDATTAFLAGEIEAVSAFPPFWSTILEQENAQELLSSAEFPGAIPDLLAVSQKLIEEKPEQVQGLINSWFDTVDFMAQNPERADEIMAARGNITLEELQLLKQGVKIFNREENITAFSAGNSLKHLPFSTQKVANFTIDVGFITEAPDLTKILDDRFIKADNQR